MKLLSAPRQPFVGLAAMAGLGIILAEFFPLSSSALVATVIIILLCALAILRWPSLTATYAVVGAGFFLLHSLQTSNTEGQPDDFAAGDNFRLSGDVTAHVLFPPRIFFARKADDQAHVIQVSIAPSTSVLFMSDSGVETERALLANGLNLHSDIIIKGQHYSGNSCAGPFLDVVRPRLIIATSREFPPNERISDNWAEELRTRGIKLFRQDETGAVTLRFDRNGWEARSYLTGETFRRSSQ